MKKYLFLFALVVAGASLLSVTAMSNQAAADVSYSCPGGQVIGVNISDGDVRYCYTPVCPPGQSKGISDSKSNNKNPDKCYQATGTTGGKNTEKITYTEKGDVSGPIAVQHERAQANNSDKLKCPDGTYRGGLIKNQDTSKCYTCSGRDCQEVAGQPLVPEHYEACAVSNRSCIRAQERAHVKYMKELRDSAPRGFNLPSNSELVIETSTARKFCRYYANMEWQTHYGSQYTYQACLIGYEVGFGGGRICSKEYLFGHDATHRRPPTLNAAGFRAEIERLPQTKKNLLISDAIKACQDGWAQYSVDYWYCEGDGACQDKLRKDKSRIIDPGPRPTKTKYVNEDGELVETYNTVTTSQSCGSVQTAYFACGFGSGVQNSTFWQLIEIVLNILIALVGIVAVGGLVYGAVRYSSAGDNSSQVEQAKTIIKNVIIGIVLFLAMWAFIQYMIPGGIL